MKRETISPEARLAMDEWHNKDVVFPPAFATEVPNADATMITADTSSALAAAPVEYDYAAALGGDDNELVRDLDTSTGTYVVADGAFTVERHSPRDAVVRAGQAATGFAVQ